MGPDRPRIRKLTKREAEVHRLALIEFPHTWNPILRASKPRPAILEICRHCGQARVRFQLRVIDFTVTRRLHDRSRRAKELEAEFHLFLESPAKMDPAKIILKP